MASVAIGAHYGVASAADAIAVKTSDNRSTTYAAIIAALEWVIHAASKSGKPSIANLSWVVRANDTVEQAVKAVIDAGIHITTAAGNTHTDACRVSLSRGELIY
jgi:ribosomal protein S11